MSRIARALMLCLAVLPAIWGTCPSWLTGVCACCARGEAVAARAPCCPLCAEREGREAPATPCSQCSCTMARDGCAPAPVPVEMPPADLTIATPIARADAESVAVATGRRERIDVRPPGGPPDLVGVVVLVV